MLSSSVKFLSVLLILLTTSCQNKIIPVQHHDFKVVPAPKSIRLHLVDRSIVDYKWPIEVEVNGRKEYADFFKGHRRMLQFNPIAGINHIKLTAPHGTSEKVTINLPEPKTLTYQIAITCMSQHRKGDIELLRLED